MPNPDPTFMARELALSRIGWARATGHEVSARHHARERAEQVVRAYSAVALARRQRQFALQDTDQLASRFRPDLETPAIAINVTAGQTSITPAAEGGLMCQRRAAMVFGRRAA